MFKTIDEYLAFVTGWTEVKTNHKQLMELISMRKTKLKSEAVYSQELVNKLFTGRRIKL